MRLQAIVLHRQQVHSKLVYIMRERLSKALKSFHSVSASWSAHAPDAGAQAAVPDRLPTTVTANGRVNAAAAKPPREKGIAEVLEQLMKQVGTLAAVLSPVMSTAQLGDIFLRIRRMYSDSLARCAR